MSEPEISPSDEGDVIDENEEKLSEIADEDILDPSLEDTDEDIRSSAIGADVEALTTGADKAIAWYRSRTGSKQFEGLCQRAARLSWGCPAKYPTAIAHWNKGRPRHTTGVPPKGSFVFWDISGNGHVGIADGKGGFWATSVKHKIGHATSVGYFRKYLGWIPGGCR